MEKNKLGFTFSDTIQGYVTHYDWDKQTFSLDTSDGRTFEVKLAANIYAELVRNLGEAFIDCTGQIKDMLAPGRFLYVYGVFFPEDEVKFEAKHLVFLGKDEQEFRFEKQDWWIKQIRQLGDFYLKAQFPDGDVDYRKYKTNLSLEGEQTGNFRQETDTMSRLVYGFATAYLLTGDDRYLEGAEKGTVYLREHMRCKDTSENITYWYHGIDVKGKHERKIFASEFGDDYDAIPAYEQIYALAGPTQTYRVTGDPEIASDIDMTLNLFDKYFYDRQLGGYFSHIDPVTFDPNAESLVGNRGRKNWNSVGDHAPAYLINAYLATGDERFKKMLVNTADTITEHFPDYEHSAFVQEKFHANWEHDSTHGWQQNRGVVGHNLKIAWNLTRINSVEGLEPEKSAAYMEFAHKIAALMPEHGCDRQRGGWYDVVERTLEEGQKFHRYAWHDRKAWWQQEQGILAYLILFGTTGKKEYLQHARESSAFYSAWFLDQDSGGIYFNVLATGIPYLLGTERLKGSHSMSGYHSFELAYLATVYQNLLITKQHLDLFFKPYAHGFKDNILRVAPDILPAGCCKIEKAWVDGKEYLDFDADNLTVKLPDTQNRVKVQVRLIPVGSVEHFTMTVDQDGDITKLTLSGELDHVAIHSFRKKLVEIASKNPAKVAFDMTALQSLVEEAVRTIIFEKQKMSIDCDLYICGANEAVKTFFDREELSEEIVLLDAYDKTKM